MAVLKATLAALALEYAYNLGHREVAQRSSAYAWALDEPGFSVEEPLPQRKAQSRVAAHALPANSRVATLLPNRAAVATVLRTFEAPAGLGQGDMLKLGRAGS